MEQGRYAEGISLEERILVRVPTFAAALNNISLMLFIQGQLEEATTTAQRVLEECDPENFHALSNLVRFLCTAGRLQGGPPLRRAAEGRSLRTGGCMDQEGRGAELLRG